MEIIFAMIPGTSSHYEILGVSPDATDEDISRAYHLALETYSESSLAVYSLYDDDELLTLRNKIEEAYRVLSSHQERSTYDSQYEGVSQEESLLNAVTAVEKLQPEVARETGELTPLGVEDELPFNGAGLRRARLERGISLNRISEVTRIGLTHLENLEEDNHEALPASVYVRGFVAGYARCIGIPQERVVTDYMTAIKKSQLDSIKQKRSKQ